jgi:O-antigen/teichoic acid export membrane protein
MPPLFAKELHTIRTAPKAVQALALLVGMVALHSMFLGIGIYFFTERFYELFFHTQVENLFYVRQAGLFLVCLGLFYVSILHGIQRMHHLVLVVITTKVLAVLFLITNACFTSVPGMIYLAAAGDGFMAFLLVIFYLKARLWLVEHESGCQ